MIRIHLKDDELKFLRDFVKKGRKNARELTRAHILLLANHQKGAQRLLKYWGLVGTPFGESRKDTWKKDFKTL